MVMKAGNKTFYARLICTAVWAFFLLPASVLADSCDRGDGFRPVRRGIVERPIFIPPDMEVTRIDLLEQPAAVVNGETVKEGDEIDGVRVFKIEEGSVEFSCEGNYFIKRLKRQPVKP